MAKIQVLYKLNTAPPSPWVVKSSYDGKYAKIATSQGDHGSLGGSAQHRHTGNSGGSVGLCGYWSRKLNNNYPAAGYQTDHSNHSLSVNDTAYVDNAPTFYTLRLIEMDLTLWEATERRFPAGAIVLADQVLSLLNLARFTSPDGRLIKLAATALATGGSDTHVDEASGVLGTGGQSASGGHAADGWNIMPHPSTHSHTFAKSVTGQSSLPRRVRTRLYEFTAQTDRAEAGIIVFIEGTPTSGYWSAVSSFSESAFVQSANENPNFTGTNTHSKSGESATSSSFSTTNGQSWDGDWSRNIANRPHTHSVSFNLASADHQPPYVQLYPMKLNTTLLHIYAQSKTWSVGALVQKKNSASITQSARMRGAGNNPLDIGAPVMKSLFLDGGAGSSIALAGLTSDLDMESRVKSINRRLMISSVSLVELGESYSMTARFVKPYIIPPPLIDTIWKAVTEQFNDLYKSIQLMETANKIDYAVGSDLDNKWGRIYQLPRFTSEADDAYRLRLKTFITIMTGSGTKPTCESVLDLITGDPGSAEVTPVWPAHAEVRFTTGDAKHAASDRETLIRYTLDRMLAAGIDYTLYLTFKDYRMGVPMIGNVATTYGAGAPILIEGMVDSYDLESRLVLSQLIESDMDALLKQKKSKQLPMLYRSKKEYSRVVALGELVKKQCPKAITADSLLKKKVSKSWQDDVLIGKYGIPKTWRMGAMSQRGYRRYLWLGAKMVTRGAEEMDLDALVFREGIRKRFYAVVPIEDNFSSSISISVKIVNE